MEVITASLAAFLITLLTIPLTIFLAKRYGLVDDPQKRPHPAHIQNRIIPRAGGLAIYLGLLISSLLFLPWSKHLAGLFAGITTLLIVGLLDDKLIHFSPYRRLGLLFVAAIFAVASGIGISFLNNPLYHLPFIPTFLQDPFIYLDKIVWYFNFFGPHKIILLADLFALLWIVTLTQVINWSKGVDGQMPGITTITALTLGIIAYQFYLQGDPNQLNIAKLAFLVTGASFAFLIFNWHPSKILPGFSGSTILAFLLAVLAILSTAKVATALLVLAVPTIDFIYTIFRRLKAGRSPVWGDRGHLHHRLLDLGWSHQKISLFYILVSAILGAVALLVNTESKLFALLLVAVGFFSLILWLNSFGGFSKPSAPDNG